jgi:hypothetical protein
VTLELTRASGSSTWSQHRCLRKQVTTVRPRGIWKPQLLAGNYFRLNRQQNWSPSRGEKAAVVP